MTQEFLNEEKIPFKDCTREDQHILLDAIIDGNTELYWIANNKWLTQGDTLTIEAISIFSVYRTKPVKRLAIPWEHIKPEYRWAAIDEDMEPFAYVDEPKIISNVWSADKGKSLVVLSIDTSGISWRDSLVERPAEVKS